VGPLRQALALAIDAGDIDKLRDVAAMGSALQKGARARGLGIESENEAAEVVIRAERAIGLVLDRMAESGTRRTRGANIHRADGYNLPGLPELGISEKNAHNFRKLAALPDDRFELMMSDVRNHAARIAKVNFYAADRPRTITRDVAYTPEAGSLPSFTRFRQGAYELLEYVLAEDGTFAATGNQLKQLPLDELTQVGELLQELIHAYQSARSGR
jgi:hypothetical protein